MYLEINTPAKWWSYDVDIIIVRLRVFSNSELFMIKEIFIKKK